MAVVKVLSTVACLWIACLALACANTRGDAAEDIIERVLRIPNSNRVLNSVLGRLERNRQELLQRIESRFNENADCSEAEGVPEYTESVENSPDLDMGHVASEGLPEYTASLEDLGERESRHIPFEKHDRICPVEKMIYRLNTNEYEYRPAYYEEVRCNRTLKGAGGHRDIDQTCTNIGLRCVQWNKTIHLTRRRFTSDCWETKTLLIPAGCECMAPVRP